MNMAKLIKKVGYYETIMRQIIPNSLLKCSKLETYGRILKLIDRNLKKLNEKKDILHKKKK